MKRHLSFISIAWPRIFYSHTIQMCGRAGCQLQFAHKKWFVHWFVHWLRFFFHFGPTIRSHFQIIYFTQMIWISTDVLNNFIRQCMQFFHSVFILLLMNPYIFYTNCLFYSLLFTFLQCKNVRRYMAKVCCMNMALEHTYIQRNAIRENTDGRRRVRV